MLDDLKNKEFWKAIIVRAALTFIEVILGLIPSSAIILSDVNWKYVLSAATLASIISILKSILLGVPEVK